MTEHKKTHWTVQWLNPDDNEWHTVPLYLIGINEMPPRPYLIIQTIAKCQSLGEHWRLLENNDTESPVFDWRFEQ
jgi:hypothetical protein